MAQKASPEVDDVISDDPPPPPNFFKSCRNYFREYCNCTSIHGFRYFGEKRTIFERVWWFIVFSICLTACIFSIYLVYQKWESSPVIVSFATRGTPIYHIPFPTVTVCPESKSKQNSFNFTDIYHKKVDKKPLTDVEKRNFEYMALVCTYYDGVKGLTYVDNYTFTDEFYEILDAVKPRWDIFNCQYMGKTTACSKLFTPMITDEGVCYTFNMLDRSEIFQKDVLHYKHFHKVPQRAVNWSMEHGYSKDAGVKAYPNRALLSGAKNAFSFDIRTKKEDTDYACKNGLQGHRVLLHIAMRMPRTSQQYFRVPLDQAVVGAVQPVMITTSESVKMYNPKRRECYFPSERNLRYFKIYSQLNCHMECLTNYTLHQCGCVNFFMPRVNGTEICGTGSIDCMANAESEMQMKDLYSKLAKPTNQTQKRVILRKKKAKIDCDCMPICTDLTYDVETSQTDYDWIKRYKAHRIRESNNVNLSEDAQHISSLTLFFKSNHFITSQRNELYGPTDFLANFGGLLGLFTGFSVLSLMEIIYFLTVRMICNSRLYGYWGGPDK